MRHHWGHHVVVFANRPPLEGYLGGYSRVAGSCNEMCLWLASAWWILAVKAHELHLQDRKTSFQQS